MHQHPSIGSAVDFYRLRVRSLDAIGEPDLEWRDDTWYRQPAADVPTGATTYLIEAVELDDPDSAHVIASTDDYQEAVALHARAAEDLAEATRSQFEAAWFPEPAAAGDDSPAGE